MTPSKVSVVSAVAASAANAYSPIVAADGSTRTLDQHIVQVRRKLGKSGDLIETMRGVGYRLLVEPPSTRR